MKKLGLLVLFVLVHFGLLSQNKDTATVSITNHRLLPGTFNWRGTTTFFDKTTWDSSPYTEGHLRQYNGTFKQNFRLLLPKNYDASYSQGYPLILVLHGGGERANCWDKGTSWDCYYGTTSYNPNTSPASATQLQLNNLLNNDHNLNHGGSPHLNAVNLAGSLKVGDPALPTRAFPGFVLFPQMLNGWGTNDVRDAIRIVRLLCKQYKIDQDRIYIHGLSNGGRGTLNALVEADWLFAAAATMSGITPHDNYRNQIDSVKNIPLWMFQGGQDTYPTPTATQATINVLKAAGGNARYTLYPTLGHGTWNTAYAEPDFFSWFLSQSKSNLHINYGSPTICGTNGAGAKLSVAQGFPAYQWEKDGVVIAGATSYEYVATLPGVYRVRFSRISSNPAENQWNRWSDPVTVTEKTPAAPVMTQTTSVVLKDLNGGNVAKLEGPEGYTNYYWYKNDVLTTLGNNRAVTINAGSCTGTCANSGTYTLVTSGIDNCPSPASNAKTLFFNDQAPINITKPSGFTATLNSSTSVLLRWNDVSGQERGYEIWRRKSTDNSTNGWTFVTITGEDVVLYLDKNLTPNTTYWYKIRAVSNTGRSDYSPGNSRTTVADNVIITTGADTTPPTAPQNLTASLIDTDIATKTNKIQLNWQPATDDDSGLKQYEIRYAGNTVVVPANQTSYLFTGLPLNTNYSYTVYAIDLSNNTSAPSNQAQANTYINGFFWEHSTGAYTDIRNIPAEVWANPEFKGRSTNLTLTPRTQEEFLVFRFYGYIYVSTAGDYLFRVRSNDGVQLYVDGTLVLRRNGTVADGSCATTNFTSGIPPVTLAPGPHTIEVRYFQYTGDKCLSIQWRGPDAGSDLTKFYDVPDSRIRSYDTYTPPAAPDVPQSLVATAAGMTQINLSWAYSGTPTPEFEIQRSMTSNGPFTIINRVSTLTYSDQNLKPGTTYYYRLRSVNDNGSSAFTPVASATTDLDTEAPTAPTNLVLYSKTINNASIGWTKSTDNTGVTGYEIWVNNVLNTTTPNNFYLLTNLQPFTDYSVYVVAYDANGNKSAASNTIQFTLNEPQIFYSKAGSAPLNDLATWGANPDGTGTAPSSFSTNGLYLYVANRTTTSIGGSWKVEGSASKVIVPDGVTLTADNSLQARVEVQDNATLILANAVVPTLVDLGSASTVQYNQSATSVFKTTYGNLILSGTGSKTFSSGTTTVLGALTASNGIALKGAAGNQSVIAFSGDVTFSGSPGITPADVSVAMQFSKAGTQTITSSGSMDLFQIKTATGTNLNLLNAGTAVTFNVGSSNGGGISIASGSTLNLNNNTLKLSGAGTINGNGETGTISVNSSTIDITSTSSLNQNLYFDAVNNSLYYLGINLGGSGVANVNTAIQVTEGLKIKKGTLNANGNVTLVSTEAKTANLQEIENNGKVLGDVKVQRYVNYKSRTYRYISSPVAGLKIADWQAYFPITGTFSGASTGTGLTSNPSLFYFYEPTGWIAYPTTSNQELIEKGKGYSAFIRNTEPFVLQMTGNPYQGDVVFALTPPNGDNTGWNLLGNPYASTIAWSNDPSAWIKTNINSVVAVRNNSSTSVGEFEYYDAATGTGTGTGGTLAGGRIAPGQAFYVRTTGPSPALTITEKAKSTGQQTFFREENETYPQLKISVTQGQKVDRAFLVFTDFGTNKFDAKWDGVKLKNDGLFNLSTMSEDNIALAINNASGDFCTQEIRLNLQNVTAGSYSLSAELLETLVGVSDVTLKDNFTNNIIDLKETPTYVFSVTSDAASYGNTRFALTFNRTEISSAFEIESNDVCGESARIKLTSTQAGATYELYDADNNVLGSTTVTEGENVEFNVDPTSLKYGINAFKVKAAMKGCGASEVTRNLDVNYSSLPSATANDVSVCYGSKATLMVESPSSSLTYKWYDQTGHEIKGSSSPSMETSPVMEETSYYVSAVTATGCVGPKFQLVVTPENLEEPELVMANDTLRTTVPASEYVWMKNDQIIATTYDPFIPSLGSGSYTLLVKQGGCSQLSKPFIITGSDEHSSLFSYSVYPNPTAETQINLIVQTRLQSDIHVKIIDVLGKEIYSDSYAPVDLETGKRIVARQGLRSGVYFMILEQENIWKKVRLVIKE